MIAQAVVDGDIHRLAVGGVRDAYRDLQEQPAFIHAYSSPVACFAVGDWPEDFRDLIRRHARFHRPAFGFRGQELAKQVGEGKGRDGAEGNADSLPHGILRDSAAFYPFSPAARTATPPAPPRRTPA